MLNAAGCMYCMLLLGSAVELVNSNIESYSVELEDEYPWRHGDLQQANVLEDDFLRKRTKPSLSIVNPLDVLRQRLLLEIARRHMKENTRQVELNRAILKNVGKRRFRSPSLADDILPRMYNKEWPDADSIRNQYKSKLQQQMPTTGHLTTDDAYDPESYYNPLDNWLINNLASASHPHNLMHLTAMTDTNRRRHPDWLKAEPFPNNVVRALIANTLTKRMRSNAEGNFIPANTLNKNFLRQ